MINPYRKTAKHVSADGSAYNPSSFGGVSESGSMVKGAGRAFSEGGEINAYDKKDALQQAVNVINQAVRDTKAGALKKESAINRQAKREAIQAALNDTEGFKVVGSELLAPIKEVIDYESWTRKMLRVRPLAQGETFRITKDVAYQAIGWVIGADGQTPMAQVQGKYLLPPEFKITSMVDIDITDIYQMQYDGLDRAQDLARQDIERKEDQALVNAFDKAATNDNDITYFASLGLTAFEDMRYQVERHRLICDKFLINRQELSDIVTTMSAGVDPVTERELILSGYIGNIFNAQIITSAGTNIFEVVKAGTVYAVTAPEYLGDLGIRIDLFSEPFNEYTIGKTRKGWAFIEQIGIGLPNARAIAKGSKQ